MVTIGIIAAALVMAWLFWAAWPRESYRPGRDDVDDNEVGGGAKL